MQQDFFHEVPKSDFKLGEDVFGHIFCLKNVKNTQKIDNFSKKFSVFITYFPKMCDLDDFFHPPPSEMTKSLPDGPIERGAATLEMPQFRPSSPQKKGGNMRGSFPPSKLVRGPGNFVRNMRGCLNRFARF